MNKHHENKLTMYMGVASVLGENSAKTAVLPALDETNIMVSVLSDGLKLFRKAVRFHQR